MGTGWAQEWVWGGHGGGHRSVQGVGTWGGHRIGCGLGTGVGMEVGVGWAQG